jgi:hypothetical protein
MRLAMNGVLGFEVSAIRWSLLITTTVVALTFSSNARAGSVFRADLDAAQEPPPLSNSTGTGVGLFTLNDAQTELSFTVTYQGLASPITGAHFHDGPVGVRGPLVHLADIMGLTPGSGTLTGVWSSSDPTTPLTPAFVSDMFAGSFYFDFHTTDNPNGDIRGQFQLVPEPAGLTLFGLGILGVAGYVWLRKGPPPARTRTPTSSIMTAGQRSASR